MKEAHADTHRQRGGEEEREEERLTQYGGRSLDEGFLSSRQKSHT